MEFGAHLPLIAFDDRRPTLGDLTDYVRTARSLGFSTLAVNDHLVFPRPWLDAPTTLAAVLHQAEGMQLMTSVSIPVVRGLVSTAKALGTLDLLSGGRLVAGIGPGSSDRDYAAVGVPFEERWKRLDEIVPAMRALWSGEEYRGTFYSTDGVRLEPLPARRVPVWIGSWGSAAGMRRVARLGDGWLASAYNATPQLFADARERLRELLDASGRDVDEFPNGISTMLMYITSSRDEGERMVRDVISRAIRRPEAELGERLLVGHPEECASKLRAYAERGAQLVLLWPIRDESRQIEAFKQEVAPLVNADR